MAIGYNENKEVTLTCDFPFAEIDARVFGHVEDEDNLTDYERGRRDGAREVLGHRFKVAWWVLNFSGEKINTDGLDIRALIWIWSEMPILWDWSLTDYSKACGMKKQSVDRWTGSFAEKFPRLAANIMAIKHEQRHIG